MFTVLAVAFWWFVPAGVANMMPVLVAKLPGLRNWNAPIDGGRMWRGKRLLGDHKTWRGLLSGVFGGMVFSIWYLVFRNYGYGVVEMDYELWRLVLLGGFLGLGALVGDAVESFLKRQFADVPSGESWFPWDQTDYIVGGMLFSLFLVRLPWEIYLWTLVLYFGLHLAVSYVGYLLRFKEKPI